LQRAAHVGDVVGRKVLLDFFCHFKRLVVMHEKAGKSPAFTGGDRRSILPIPENPQEVSPGSTRAGHETLRSSLE
jgi:hypothetical protein